MISALEPDIKLDRNFPRNILPSYLYVGRNFVNSQQETSDVDSRWYIACLRHAKRKLFPLYRWGERGKGGALFSSARSAGDGCQLVGWSANGILIPQLRLSDSAAVAVSLRFPTSGRINVRVGRGVSRAFGRVSMEVSINGARTAVRFQIDPAVTFSLSLSLAYLTRVQLSAELTANLSRVPRQILVSDTIRKRYSASRLISQSYKRRVTAHLRFESKIINRSD